MVTLTPVELEALELVNGRWWTVAEVDVALRASGVRPGRAGGAIAYLRRKGLVTRLPGPSLGSETYTASALGVELLGGLDALAHEMVRELHPNRQAIQARDERRRPLEVM
jgi:hypothetical protein